MDGARTHATLLDRSAALLLVLALIALATHRIVAYDLWWQLAAGDWILAKGLPETDPFSYAFPDRPWIELRWLAFVAAAFGERAIGLDGLILAKVALLLATFGTLYAALRPSGPVSNWPIHLGLLLALALMFSRFKLRPELFTFLGTAVFLLGLERHRLGEGARWLLWLPAFQLVWSNTHTLWPLGPALVWTAWGVALWEGRASDQARTRARALGGAALAVSACALITPYALRGQLFPLTFLEQLRVGSELRGEILELASPLAFARFDFFFVSYVCAAAVSLASFVAAPRLSLFRLLLWAGSLALSLLSARHVSLFGLFAGFVVARNLGDAAAERSIPRSVSRALQVAVAGVALALAAGAVGNGLWRSLGWEQRFGLGVARELFPMASMQFVRAQGLATPVFGDLGAGGYLIRESPQGGERSVFIDGRLEVYGARTVVDAGNLFRDPPALLARLEELGVRTAILSFPGMRAAVSAFERDPRWLPVAFEPRFVVYARADGPEAARVRSLAIDWAAVARTPHAALRAAGSAAPADASDSLEREGSLLVHVGALGAARERFAEALDADPRNARARLGLGVVMHALGDVEAAGRVLAPLDAAVLERAEVWRLRAHLASQVGNEDDRARFAAEAARAATR